MTGADSEGWFNYEGWLLRGGRDESAAGRFASAHESHHKQLADSTAFGALTRVLRGVDPTRATGFNRVCSPVQEAFASWAPAIALGLGRDQVAQAYPGYLRHWDSMERAIALAASPYLRLQAAHACARAAMQAPVIDIALDVGLARLTMAHIRRYDRPDHRFALLHRHPVDWPAIARTLDIELAVESRWPAVRDAGELHAGLFAPDLRDLWLQVNIACYEACTGRLAQYGCRSLDHDEHREQIARLVETTTTSLSARSAVDHGDAAAIVLSNLEAETYVTGARLPARMLGPATPAQHLIAGSGRRHLFLSIRRGADVLANFTLAGGPAITPGSVVEHLRHAGMETDGGLAVDLLDVGCRTPDDLRAVGVPVYAAVAISAFDQERRRRWGDFLDPAHAALILDVPLSAHFGVWLRNPDAVLRYAFLRTEAHGRIVPFLLATIDIVGTTSHLLVRALSPPAVRTFHAAFDELADTGLGLVEDPSFIERHDELLEIILGHVALEERVFPGFG